MQKDVKASNMKLYNYRLKYALKEDEERQQRLEEARLKREEEIRKALELAGEASLGGGGRTAPRRSGVGSVDG